MFVFTLKDVVGLVAIAISLLIWAIYGVSLLCIKLKSKWSKRKSKKSVDSLKRCSICNKTIQDDKQLCDNCTHKLNEVFCQDGGK